MEKKNEKKQEEPKAPKKEAQAKECKCPTPEKKPAKK